MGKKFNFWKWLSRNFDKSEMKIGVAEIQLARLRQIGWDEWDPIGIRQINDTDWRTGAADEYDAYLLDVAHMLDQGKSSDEAVEYLDMIFSEHMGLGQVTDLSHCASVRTVSEINRYLEILRPAR